MRTYHGEAVEFPSIVKHMDPERLICYGNTVTLVTLWSRTQIHGLELELGAWQRLG
jgi:hypothetical protein